MLTVEMQIAARARKYAEEPITNLHHFIDLEVLHHSLDSLNKDGASGVDGQHWKDYDARRDELLGVLFTAFKSGRYRAPNIRRVYIPKGDGGRRPLGMPTVEDKILQTAVNKVLTPIYEQIFYSSSYGFRPGKSPHQALEQLFTEVSFKGKRYIIDADMRNYFDSINHGRLREFLSQRIRDRVVTRMINKWLKAGIMEQGRVHYPEQGTPQGGNISPLLSNIYLHYVLDEWFIEQVQPLLKGSSTLIRFADDFVLLFSDKSDAKRVLKVLPKRLGKYGLSLHPDKTKLIELVRGEVQGPRTFDFLGFTHYVGKSRKGTRILKRKTSSKKLRGSLKRTGEWIKHNRHQSTRSLITQLNRKLDGHYGYYGITFNSGGLHSYFEQVRRLLFKWLNRRGGKRKLIWEEYDVLITRLIPLNKPKIYHNFSVAKP